METGQAVEVEFPDGWRSGFTFMDTCTALDRDYRVNVRDGNGHEWLELAPECVRAA